MTALILSQAILNTFAVLGLAPLTGVPLPFVSYGSSSLIVMLAGDGAAAERRLGRDRPRARGRTHAHALHATFAPANRDDWPVSAAPSRIVIAAGGTAGHVVPALAVAEALRAEGAEVEFIGGERAEAQLVPAAGFALHAISVEGLSRSNPLRALRALALAAAARAAGAATAARRFAPTPCWAAAATSPARSGWRR